MIELIGTNEIRWNDAAKSVIEKADETLKDLRVAEVTSQDIKLVGGKTVTYRTKRKLFLFIDDY